MALTNQSFHECVRVVVTASDQGFAWVYLHFRQKLHDEKWIKATSHIVGHGLLRRVELFVVAAARRPVEEAAGDATYCKQNRYK